MASGPWWRALAATLILTMAGAASAQVARGGAGFADPQGAPPRAAERDIEPVFRPPSVDTLATIRLRGVLRVGVAVSEPMAMHDARGEMIGYSVDLARRLADDLGTDIELVETSWSSMIPDLLERRFDLIASGLWVTVPRALVINFSSPTAVEGVHLVANQALAKGRQTIADFNKPGVRIVVYAGTAQERDAQRHFPQATVVRVSGDEDHLAEVLAGKAHAALVPTFAPQGIIRLAPDVLSLPIAQPLSTAPTAFGVRRGDADFLSFLNTWLELQRAAGWLDERVRYWSETLGVAR